VKLIDPEETEPDWFRSTQRMEGDSPLEVFTASPSSSSSEIEDEESKLAMEDAEGIPAVSPVDSETSP